MNMSIVVIIALVMGAAVFTVTYSSVCCDGGALRAVMVSTMGAVLGFGITGWLALIWSGR